MFLTDSGHTKYIVFMNIARLVFNPFQENTYVLWDDTGECVVVDAGNYNSKEDGALSKFIADKGLKPVMALNTHGHVDHILGVPYVKRNFSSAFGLHSGDNFLVETAPEHGRIYGFNMQEIPSPDIDLKDMEEIKFGNTSLRIIHTPGHTPGHVCFYEPENKILLSGDTLFRESIGRTDLPGGDYGWIMKSIINNILPLGEEVVFYPGHGPESTLGHEMLYNPFITEVMGGEVSPY
jgi:Zn-dependent hydrolases, including glyoxylases